MQVVNKFSKLHMPYRYLQFFIYFLAG